MPDRNRPPNAPITVAEIEKASFEFHQLATTVSDQLKAFEQWFSSLPGKMEVAVGRGSGSAVPETILRLSRYKDGWKLMFGFDETQLQGLDTLSLHDKCIAISLLPELLNALIAEQQESIALLKHAVDIFSQFPNVKGGK